MRAPLAPRHFRFRCACGRACWAWVSAVPRLSSWLFLAGLSGCVFCTFFFFCFVVSVAGCPWPCGPLGSDSGGWWGASAGVDTWEWVSIAVLDAPLDTDSGASCVRILIYSYLDPIPRIPRSTGLLLQMHAAAMTVQFSAVSIYGWGRLGRMGRINGSAHTQAWSSYGEVHETVRTVCEYQMDESGITEKIAISITGSLELTKM